MPLPKNTVIGSLGVAYWAFTRLGRDGETRDESSKGLRTRPKRNPPIGAIVYRRLSLGPLYNVAEHSGVHLGQGRFASKQYDGKVLIQKLDEFLGSKCSLFVSAREPKPFGDSAVPRPWGRFIVAIRALMQAGKRRNNNESDVHEDGRYGLFFNNCHAFTGYCVTGEKVDITGLSKLKKTAKVSHWVEWRYEP